ncbi:MAG: hypothetical protein K0Q59_4609 [Paenibacillus sp.]|nr:hypothetical protein [Paenibacillus sp.]
MKKSKYPDDQMRVLEVLFSDEVQSVMVKKTLRKSPLKDPKYLQQYGGDYVELQGKRLQSIFKSGFGPAPKLSPHYSKASSLATTEAENVIKGQKDINTALRDLEEKIKAYIAANPQ